jgi:serine/threonine protein kinase
MALSLGEADFAGTDRFEVQRRLGAGGMGVVYQAWDRERKAAVALKTLRDLDPHSLYLFKHEFRALADLHHPNLIRLGELICDRGFWFFTMEFVDGVGFLTYTRGGDSGDPRAETLPGGPVFDEQRLRAALGQLALGAVALHDAGKVHRDIKPSNVMVTPNGRAVLLDFGLVVEAAAEQRSDTNVVGTAMYMAPEQGASKKVGPQADWYSIGTMLYESLTGQAPFAGGPLEVLMQKQKTEPPPPRSIAPTVPADLDRLCADLLRFSPEARPTGRQVLERLGVRDLGAVAGGAAPSLSSLSPIFVGRRRELQLLREAYEDTRKGAPVTVFLHGESGLGKSALVRRFLDELDAERALPVVLQGRCYERESVPFKAFDGVVDALSRYLSRIEPVEAAATLPRDAALLARVFPVLRRVPAMAQMPQSRASPNPQELRGRAFLALRELLSRLCERRAVVLYIDDFQWADADSLALLLELLHKPDAPPLFLVATVRTLPSTEEGRRSALAQAAQGLGDVRDLHLQTLSATESHELTTQLLRATVGAAVSTIDAGSLADEGSGHPLFLQELVRHVASAGAGAAPRRVRLDDALWARIEQLETPARRLLEVIAVAGAPIAHELAAQAAGLSHDEAAHATPLLRVAHLVRAASARVLGPEGASRDGAVEPYHDRIREAVLAHLDAETRRRHHERIAAALEGSGAGAAQPQALVSHLEAAGQPERAAEHALAAARRATEALAFDQAAELLRIALRLGQHTAAPRRKLSLELGDALANAGRGAEAADAFLAAATDGADAATRFECQRRAAEQLLGSGHLERGLSVLEAVLTEIGEKLPATPRRALASLLWNRAALRLSGLRFTERDASEIPARELTRLEVYKAVSIGMGMVDAIRGADFQARGLRLALRTGERRQLGRAIALEAIYQASQGGAHLPRARALADEALRMAKQSDDPYLLAFSQGAHGIVLLNSGKFREASVELAAAEARMRDETTGTALELANARIFRMLALRYMGEHEQLRRGFHEYVRDAIRRGDRFTETTMIRAFGIVYLLEDQPDEAERALDRRSWTPPEGGYHIQHWYELLARVELGLYRGQGAGFGERYREELAALERSLLPRMQMIRAAVLWMRARFALAEAEGAADPAPALREAEALARRLAKERVPYIDVWALFLEAAVLTQRGDTARALAQLRTATELSTAQDRRFYAAAARRRQGELTGGDEGAALIAAADAAMRFDGIVNPERVAAVAVPGFRRAPPKRQ